MKTMTRETVRIGRKRFEAFGGQLVAFCVRMDDPCTHMGGGGLPAARRIAEERGHCAYVHADGERVSMFVRGQRGRVRKVYTRRYYKLEMVRTLAG